MDPYDVIKIYVPRDGGEYLECYGDRQFKDFHGVLPQIGDHISNTPGWIGEPGNTDGNLFLIVTGRYFMHHEIALICEHRRATPAEFELF
ncbi:MAG: hypothetical protein KYX67_10735 [Brevundimonas sp.]|uniref:hypothetical protein n=1 Tax=Brevundimonas sp. TaxID=1871086 RepID=UPI00256C6DB5|nr:hypothetical protein [Brevundimonas sp.]MDK2747785.1 hypothetical protein [Brevundimonas sp.]